MSPVSTSKKKILLIDDEDLVLKTVRKVLEREGYEVMACRSADEAIERVRTEVPDLIVSDVRMPKMNGLEAIKKIRELLEPSRGTAVREIIVTGFAEDAACTEAERMKVAEYIYKPFDLKDFLACVKKNIGA